ncbi:unnamed protein product [Clonostachys chloroleuca]|uniref:SCD domain-containing protein n=1 Tax=Clonostachys chloroleuca TaxID=1926264 RepID=A0AA35QEC2_9HYPO|nr:unnamed protein product [Clonostachys chloroleuca]
MDSNGNPSPDPDTAARRRSGRVVRAPDKFSPEAAGPSSVAKRKRDAGEEGEDDENDDPEVDDESDEADQLSDDEPAPSRRARKSSQTKRAKKPSAKKPKINGTQHATANNTVTLPRMPKKVVRLDTGDKGTGLYAEIFSQGNSSDTVAQQWLESYRKDTTVALLDLINCVLQCIGCEQEVTIDDIRDPDNIPNRLRDLENSYLEQQETEYPLISRSKSAKSFRDLLLGFFASWVELLHESELLYKDEEVMENVQSWLGSMSSSRVRSFRHTATTISLSVTSGLVEVASTLDHRITNIEQQLQASKRGKNKPRTAEFQQNLDEANEYRDKCTNILQLYFDVVFVHRYRDSDPKIRTECVEALGHWIWELPTVFMEPSYLRYLGWMLSDTYGPTRQEVLKQLARIFKRDSEQLGHFIDRFRPRLVEIATRDAEVAVRVAAIAAIDTLREAALLNPEELDVIGQLIYDNEIRIRKAVVGFFVACVDEVFASTVQALGGTDALDEFDSTDDDDYNTPRREWVNIKCLAETLSGYNSQIEERQQTGGLAGLDVAVDLLATHAPETRISLASQVLYERVPEIKRWQLLAGYLLFDHTTSTKAKSRSRKADSPEAAFKRAVTPSPAEELILLQVLVSGVKLNLTHVVESNDKGRRRVPRHDIEAAQEEIAIELSDIIPQLLSKFGAEPETATTVLQLEHFVALESFQQLRQDTSKYDALLDEVCTQFNRHDDIRVISEATAALLHARRQEELEELTDAKLATLWESNINALRNIDKTCELSARGNLAAGSLKSLSIVLMKISKLSGISDCIELLEAEGSSDDSSSPVVGILSNIVHRGKFEPQEDEIDDLEDEVVSYAIKACQFYFMWKVRSLSKLISGGAGVLGEDLDRLFVLRSTYRRYLIETFSSRAAIDELRLFATGCLCDLHLTFATLRTPIENYRPSSSSASHSSADNLQKLVQDIESGLVPELLQIFDGAEKQYAKRSKRDKSLNTPADDDEPIDDDPMDDEGENDEDENLTPEERFAAELKSEKALCELAAKLVLAIRAKIIDRRGSEAGKLRRRLQRNSTKLGNNFREVISYLDESKRVKQDKKKGGAKTDKQTLSKERIEVDDEDEDDLEVEEIEDVEDVADNEKEDLGGELEDDPIEDVDDEPEERQNNDRDDSILGD